MLMHVNYLKYINDDFSYIPSLRQAELPMLIISNLDVVTSSESVSGVRTINQFDQS